MAVRLGNLIACSLLKEVRLVRADQEDKTTTQST